MQTIWFDLIYNRKHNVLREYIFAQLISFLNIYSKSFCTVNKWVLHKESSLSLSFIQRGLGLPPLWGTLALSPGLTNNSARRCSGLYCARQAVGAAVRREPGGAGRDKGKEGGEGGLGPAASKAPGLRARGSCAPRFSFVRFLVSSKKFQNRPESASCWASLDAGCASNFHLLPPAGGSRAPLIAPRRPRCTFTQTGGGLLSPLSAAAILTGLEEAFLCVLCSRGEAAPRLPLRQRAAPEAYGTRARLGAGWGRAAAEFWALRPGVQAPPPADLRAPSPPSPAPPQAAGEAAAEDRAAVPGRAVLREKIRVRAAGRGPPPAGASQTRAFGKKPKLGTPAPAGWRGAVPGAARRLFA